MEEVTEACQENESAKREVATVEKTSDFYGLSWHRKKNIWQARVWHNATLHYAGFSQDEDVAAAMVNAKCDELKIARKNPSVGAVVFDSADAKLDAKFVFS